MCRIWSMIHYIGKLQISFCCNERYFHPMHTEEKLIFLNKFVQNSDMRRLILFDHLMWERFYSHSIFIFLFSCDFTPFWEGRHSSIRGVCLPVFFGKSLFLACAVQCCALYVGEGGIGKWCGHPSIISNPRSGQRIPTSITINTSPTTKQQKYCQ